jgi:glycosyltransferase involved in cell wall biosynthesis
MRRDPPDLLFVPSHVVPPVHPPSVVTIHDLGYLVEPDAHEQMHRKQLEWTTRWNARGASGLIAVSQATKNDLVERLQIDPSRIDVIHHGVSEQLRPAMPDEINGIRERYRLGSRTVLAVGTIQPRKNLVRLIQAFERLAAQNDDIELVLCGAPGWQGDRILARADASPFNGRIRHLGYVPDSDLAALYSSATLLAFPSLYEGFGMPALEAMACGTPVIAANRSALPEICGDAALLVDPFDVDSIAGGMQDVLTDDELRQSMVARGLVRARSFRWSDCAMQTLAFLRSIGDN